MTIGWRSLVLSLAVLTAMLPGRAVADRDVPPDSGLPAFDALPIVRDSHYRASGAIRPFLFWISRDNVGAARMTRRRAADGTVALDMLTGSDPARAPFGTNRWGYIRETVRGNQAELLAVKTETEEESIEEARANVRNKDASRQLLFIREQVGPREAIAWTTLADVGREVSFRDVDFVLDKMPKLADWHERRLARPPDARPGFLTAFAEMMDATAKRATGGQGGIEGAPERVTYIHRAELFDLRQDHIERVDFPAPSGERVPALRARFRIWNRQTRQWSGDYTAVYGASGPLAGIPLKLTYQPRWWLRTEMAIDETTPHAW